MILDFPLTIVTEGTTRLMVPADHASTGPSSSDMPVFYNPQMEFNRDVSVAILGRLLKNGDSFLDGLSATGARGIRVARESGPRLDLHLNDGNQMATELMGRNAALNGLTANITGSDLRALLLTGNYSAVDIDPFGSPAPFFPMAVGAVRREGVLCVTATDTGTISGIFREACKRKYGCSGGRTPFCHEIGVRNLIGFIARHAATSDRGIAPLMSYYSDHYVRTFVRVEKGAKRADESIGKLGYCTYDGATLERSFSRECSEGAIGPIWIGPTCDSDLLGTSGFPPHLKSADRIQELLDCLRAEGAVNRPFFLIDEFARSYKIDPPKMDDFIARLRESGAAMRTHYGPKSFRTDSTIEQIVEAMKNS